MKQGIYGASVLRTIERLHNPRGYSPPWSSSTIIDSIYHLIPRWIDFHERPGDLARLFRGRYRLLVFASWHRHLSQRPSWLRRKDCIASLEPVVPL